MGKVKISSSAWRIILVMFAMSMLMFFLVVFDRSDEKKAEIAERQELVGEYVVLGPQEDTLEILKYHIWHKEYVLEDGQRASPELVAVLLVR